MREDPDIPRRKTPESRRLGRAVGQLAAATVDGPVGVDAVHIPTWAQYVARTGEPLLRGTYQPGELAYSDGRVDRLSSRLAAKEAVLKVLGTGVRGIGFRDVEIVSAPEGQPSVRLHGPAAERAAALGLDRIEVSLCHEGDFALAVAAGRRTVRCQ